MSQLPYDIIQKILLYRPVHPVAHLIHKLNKQIDQSFCRCRTKTCRQNDLRSIYKQNMENNGKWNFHAIVLQDLKWYLLDRYSKSNSTMIFDRTDKVLHSYTF